MVRDKDNNIDMCGNQAHGQCEWLCRASVVFVAKAQRGHWSSRSPVPLLLVQVVPGVPRIRDQHRVTVKGNHHTAARMGQLSILLALPRTTRTRAHPLPLSCLLLLSPCVVLTRLLCFVWLFWCVFDCLCVFFVLSTAVLRIAPVPA